MWANVIGGVCKEYWRRVEPAAGSRLPGCREPAACLNEHCMHLDCLIIRHGPR